LLRNCVSATVCAISLNVHVCVFVHTLTDTISCLQLCVYDGNDHCIGVEVLHVNIWSRWSVVLGTAGSQRLLVLACRMNDLNCLLLQVAVPTSAVVLAPSLAVSMLCN